MIYRQIKRLTTFLLPVADPVHSPQRRLSTSRPVKVPSGFSINGEQDPSSLDARNCRSPAEMLQATLAVVATAKGSL